MTPTDATRPADTRGPLMTITPETIAELRGLMEITSPPPWEWTEDLTALLSGYEGETRVVDTAMAFRAYYQLRVATSDATLIAAAVNALPALLDTAERLAEVAAERDALAEWREKVALAAGIADDFRGEGRGVFLEADPDRASEAVAHLFETANEHEGCPVPCDEGHDGEQWEWPLSCPDCRGSGMAGPSSIDFLDGVIPNSLAHPGECETCAGDGRDHCGTMHLVRFDTAKEMELTVLDDLAEVRAERDALAAAVARVREGHTPYPDYLPGPNGVPIRWERCQRCNGAYPCQPIRALDGSGS